MFCQQNDNTLLYKKTTMACVPFTVFGYCVQLRVTILLHRVYCAWGKLGKMLYIIQNPQRCWNLI